MKKDINNIAMYLYARQLEEMKKITKLSMSSENKTELANNFLNNIVNDLRGRKISKKLIVLNIDKVPKNFSVFESLSLACNKILEEYCKLLPKVEE